MGKKIRIKLFEEFCELYEYQIPDTFRTNHHPMTGGVGAYHSFDTPAFRVKLLGIQWSRRESEPNRDTGSWVEPPVKKGDIVEVRDLDDREKVLRGRFVRGEKRDDGTWAEVTLIDEDGGDMKTLRPADFSGERELDTWKSGDKPMQGYDARIGLEETDDD